MSLVLTGGRAWDGLTAAPRAADIAVEDGVIATQAGPNAERIDITGCVAIPGLIEGHAHLCFDATPGWRDTFDRSSSHEMLLQMAGHAQAMLRAGITTVRDLGAPTELAVALRNAIAAGQVAGPSLLVSGAPVTTTGGHCYFLAGEADGEPGMRLAVRERAKAGVDWIKVMATGGNMTPGTNVFAPQYTLAELGAGLEEAHRLGKRVTAHCHGIEGVRLAVEAGVDMIEHCTCSTPEGIVRDDALLAEIARKGIVVSPTVSVGYRRWPDDGRKEARAGVTRGFFEHGCQVLVSTDCGIPGVPHDALAEGMMVLQEMTGLAPVEVLRLATSTSAALLGLDDRGTLRKGCRADIVVVEGDPTEDLAALTRVRAVICGGTVVYGRGFARSQSRSYTRKEP